MRRWKPGGRAEAAPHLLPVAEKSSEEDEFAEVVGVMVHDQEKFAEQGFIVREFDGLEGIALFEQSQEIFAVAADGADRL